MKRILSILLVTVMCLSMSVSAALNLKQDAVTVEVSFVDATSGARITTATPGSKVAVAIFIYNTDETDVVIAANKANTFCYGIKVPSEIVDSAYAGADEMDYTTSAGTALIYDDPERDGTFWINEDDIDISGGVTYTKNAYAVRVGEFTMPAAEKSYTVTFNNDYSSLADTDGLAKPIWKTATIKVESAAPTPVAPTFGDTTSLGSDGVAITGKDGVKYDNAFAVSATVTPNDATEIGVLFIPAKVLGEGTLTNETETAVKAVYDKALGTGAVTFKAAIKDIPRFLQGVSFDMVSRAYAKTGTTYNYGTAATTTVQFGNTGNVD